MAAHLRPHLDTPRSRTSSRDLQAQSTCAQHRAARLSSRFDELEKTGRFSQSGSNKSAGTPPGATEYR